MEFILIKKAESYDLAKYTSITAEGLKIALTGAKAVYDNPKATQEEVDSTYVSLRQAIFDLRLIPDKSALEELIKETEKLDFSLYTVESAAAVQKAYGKAVKVFNNVNADQAEVDKAVKELKIAKENLKLSDNADKKPTTQSGDGKDKVAKTGDATALVSWGMAGIFAIFAVAVAFFGRTRRR